LVYDILNVLADVGFDLGARISLGLSPHLDCLNLVEHLVRLVQNLADLVPAPGSGGLESSKSLKLRLKLKCLYIAAIPPFPFIITRTLFFKSSEDISSNIPFFN
jgi:hypothetical protein